MMLTLVNRARVDPQADLADCTSCAEASCYSPVAPVGYSFSLNRAARFHSGNLTRTGSPLQHDSPCDLVADLADRYPPNGSCLGESECACVGGQLGCAGACPRFAERVGHFSGGVRRENAASGGDPMYIFYLWLHERDSDPGCGWRYSNGHRFNILAGDIRAGGMGNDGWWTQDFGATSEPGPVYSGAHHPQSGGDGTVFSFRVSYADQSAPRQAVVSIDGHCQNLSVERQASEDPAFSASYVLEAAVGPGCHSYHFRFETAAGEIVTVPGRGSYGVGSAGCEDWTDQRPVGDGSCGRCIPSCAERQCGDDGCGGSCGFCGSQHSCQSGLCEPEPSGDAGSPDDAAAITLGVDAGLASTGADAAVNDSSMFDEPGTHDKRELADGMTRAGNNRQVELGQGLSCRAVVASNGWPWILLLMVRARRRRRTALAGQERSSVSVKGSEDERACQKLSSTI